MISESSAHSIKLLNCPDNLSLRLDCLSLAMTGSQNVVRLEAYMVLANLALHVSVHFI